MPNKIKSSKQFRFFEAAKSGKVPGLGSATASEVLGKESKKKKSMFALSKFGKGK